MLYEGDTAVNAEFAYVEQTGAKLCSDVCVGPAEHNSGYNVKVGRFVDIAEWYASSNQWSWQTLLLCLGNRTSLGLYVGLGARELA